MGAQRVELETEANKRGWSLTELRHDVASGGSTRKRPGLEAAICQIERGEADVLLVTKLDRLARSSLDFATILARAESNHWRLVMLQPDVDTSTPAGRLVAAVLAAMAEYERALIAERTKAARAQAIREGKPVGGRPQGSHEMPDHVRGLICEGRADGLSYRDICAALTDLDVSPPRGGRWHVETVRRAVAV